MPHIGTCDDGVIFHQGRQRSTYHVEKRYCQIQRELSLVRYMQKDESALYSEENYPRV